MSNRPLVSVRCLVYNHEPYLRQCLDGFVMQKTDFPFEAIVHDDASTDNSAAIIREYAEKYPDIIKPIYESENQYRKGTIGKIMDNAISPFSKYIAICEGDDYWTDPLKLQKQVDVMEKYPECTMCCSNGFSYSETDHTSSLINPIPVEESRFLSAHEVFLEENALIPTCSMCYRKEIADSMPDFFRQAPVGDRPIRMWCAIKGKIFYHQEPLIAYRYGAIGCYTQRVKRNSEYAKRIYDNMITFFDKFDELTKHKYHDDVEYMKDREAYVYYRNTANNRKVLTSKFLNNYPFKKRTIIRLKCFAKLIPGVYPLYKLISKQS